MQDDNKLLEKVWNDHAVCGKWPPSDNQILHNNTVNAYLI